jgi:5-oxoprolinase (ATP-hydrolysing)
LITVADRNQVRADLQAAYDEGYRALAVCLMHSYTFADHERIVGELATEIGFEQISLSSVLMPMCKIVPRAHSANADAYLTPEVKKYIAGFTAGFEDLENGGCPCEFMKSDGGLVEFSRQVTASSEGQIRLTAFKAIRSLRDSVWSGRRGRRI